MSDLVNKLQDQVKNLTNQLRLKDHQIKVRDTSLGEQMSAVLQARTYSSTQQAALEEQEHKLNVHVANGKKKDEEIATLKKQLETLSDAAALQKENDRLTRVVAALDAEIGKLQSRSEPEQGDCKAA